MDKEVGVEASAFLQDLVTKLQFGDVGLQSVNGNEEMHIRNQEVDIDDLTRICKVEPHDTI